MFQKVTMTSQLFCALFFSVAFSTDSVIGLTAFPHECNVVNSGLVVTWSFKKFFCWKTIKKERREGFNCVWQTKDNSTHKSQ